MRACLSCVLYLTMLIYSTRNLQYTCACVSVMCIVYRRANLQYTCVCMSCVLYIMVLIYKCVCLSCVLYITVLIYSTRVRLACVLYIMVLPAQKGIQATTATTTTNSNRAPFCQPTRSPDPVAEPRLPQRTSSSSCDVFGELTLVPFPCQLSPGGDVFSF